jgi:hypothetical protein
MKNGEVWNLKVPREFEVSEALVERWLCVSMQGWPRLHPSPSWRCEDLPRGPVCDETGQFAVPMAVRAFGGVCWTSLEAVCILINAIVMFRELCRVYACSAMVSTVTQSHNFTTSQLAVVMGCLWYRRARGLGRLWVSHVYEYGRSKA